MAGLTMVPTACVPCHQYKPSAGMAGQNKKLRVGKLHNKEPSPDPSWLEAGLNSETGFKSMYYRTVIYIYTHIYL